jgi:multiple antibiotic resistance protein
VRGVPRTLEKGVEACRDWKAEHLEFALLSAGSLFAILNPFATAPTFLALTEEETPIQQISMAARACLLSFLLLGLFSVLGQSILTSFRVTVPAFQIAGGLVVLRVAFQLLGGERSRLTPAEHDEAQTKEDITVTPLAMPILCGPATLSTGIVLGAQAANLGEQLTLVVVIAGLYTLTFCFLYAAVRSSRWIGPLVLRVTGRLMGMLLAAVAVQFILSGFASVPTPHP